MSFYARNKEIEQLRAIARLSAETAQMTVISGRKRVGKTELLRHLFWNRGEGGEKAAYFFVGQKNERLLAQELASIARNWLGMSPAETETSLPTIFEEILEYSHERNLTLIIDECQGIHQLDAKIYDQLAQAWKTHKARCRINLIFCGSNHALMTKLFDDEKAPFYGCVDNRIHLQPFGIETIKEIMSDGNPNYTPDDLIAMCMTTGGVAQYVEYMVSKGAYTKKAIFDATISADSYLLNEGRDLLVEELGRDSQTYFTILSAIANGLTSRNDITAYVGNECGGYLDKLERIYALATRHRPYLKPDISRDVQYGLRDNFLTFWLRYIHRHRSAVEFGDMEYVRKQVEEDYETYSKTMIKKYFRQKYRETGEYDMVVNYWERGTANTIDLIAVNDRKKKIVVADCAFDKRCLDIGNLKKKAANIIAKQSDYEYEFLTLDIKEM